MIHRLGSAALVAAALFTSGPAAVADSVTDTSLSSGVWRNPKDSVHVELRPCGTSTCGYVVWASAKAQADARKGGTESLIGLQLLRDFAPEKEGGSWRGKVFVPDLNITVAGTAELIAPDAMRAKGCIIPKILCKSQIWRRVVNAAG